MLNFCCGFNNIDPINVQTSINNINIYKMKNLLFIVSVLLMTVSTLFATNGDKETKSINTSKSTVQWLGKKVTGEHTGKVTIKSGELTFDNGALIGGQINIDMSSITVEDLEGEWGEKLRGHLTSDDFFGTATYPTATLTITKVTPKDGIYAIDADLTIKGKAAPISFNATMAGNTASADIVVDRTVYNVRYGSGKFFDNLGDKTIYDDFNLSVNLVLE